MLQNVTQDTGLGWILGTTKAEELRWGVFENMLRRILGPKGEEVVEGWRELHTEELHNMYTSPNIVTEIKSRRMRQAHHVAWLGR
jgi:hypothetical protein